MTNLQLDITVEWLLIVFEPTGKWLILTEKYTKMVNNRKTTRFVVFFSDKLFFKVRSNTYVVNQLFLLTHHFKPNFTFALWGSCNYKQ